METGFPPCTDIRYLRGKPAFYCSGVGPLDIRGYRHRDVYPATLKHLFAKFSQQLHQQGTDVLQLFLMNG